MTTSAALPPRPPSRRSTMARGLGSLLALTSLLVAVPVVLWSVAGSPVPDRGFTAGQAWDALLAPASDDNLILLVVRDAAWLLWLAFCAATLLEVTSHLYGRGAPRLPGLGSVQHLTRTLVTSITLMLSTPSTLTLGAGAAPHIAAAPATVITAADTATPLHHDSSTSEQHTAHTPDRHTVRPRDTLWGIAERKLGDGQRWREIARLNGISNPRTLQPGTVLKLPAHHRPPAGRPPDHRPPDTGNAATPPPRHITPPRHQHSPPATHPVPKPREPSSPTPAAPTPSTAPTTPATPPSQPVRPDSAEPGVSLRSGALLSLGLATSIGIAAAAARLHRRRRRVPDPLRLALAAPEPVTSAVQQALRASRLAHQNEQPRPDEHVVAQDLLMGPPTHLHVGVRDGQPVALPLAGVAVALTGPGAADCARAWVTDLLANAHRSRVELFIEQSQAAVVLPGGPDDTEQLLQEIPGLAITPDLNAALLHMETEILHRARMLADHDVHDIGQLRTADPAEPLPAIMLVTKPDQRHAATLEAGLRLADRYGIGAILLGDWASGTCCHVDTDGKVTAATGPHADLLQDAQLFHLDSTEAHDLLSLIRTGRGAAEPATPPPPRTVRDQPDQDPEEPASDLVPPASRSARHPKVTVRVLGPTRVQADDNEVVSGLRRISRDLLVLLALHPQGVIREQGIEAICPDRDPDSGATMWHTAINNTRKVLRTATGQRDAMFVIHLDGRYRLDADLVDVDLWQLLTALDSAAHASNDTDRIQALGQLAELYTGELAEDLTHDWAEIERERIRRTATDALVRWAQLLKQNDLIDRALSAMEMASDHDPYSEFLARDLMTLQARLGRQDAVRRTYRLLKRRLEDLDVDPDDETERLVTSLLRDHQSRN